MQSRSLTLPGGLWSDLKSGATTFGFAYSGETSFAHSGFGHGDFLHPTSGTFNKTDVWYWKGVGYTPAAQLPYTNVIRRRGNFGTYFTPAWDVSWIPRVEGEAVSKAYDMIRASSDLAIDLAESYQTVRMVKKLREVTNLIRSIHPNQWARRWLEYQYGWKPLVTTVFDLADQLKNGHVTGHQLFETFSKEVQQGTRIVTEPCNMTPQIEQYTITRRVKLRTEWRLQDSAVNHFANWSSLNPASIAWELVPFSFVADWFYDVGSYLRDMESFWLYRNQFVSAYSTRTSMRVGTCRCSSSGNGYAPAILDGGYIHKYKNRAAITLDLPRLPKFQAKLGASRVLSAAALISAHLGLVPRRMSGMIIGPALFADS